MDIVQYHVFCQRIQMELSQLHRALLATGLECKLKIQVVEDRDRGYGLVERLCDNGKDFDGEESAKMSMSGQVVFRIDKRSVVC